MRRRPPISTRTDTLFPYTTLFRSFDSLAEWSHPCCEHIMLQRVVADYFAVRYPARSAGFGRQRDAERALALLFPGFLGGRRSVTTARTHAREGGADHHLRVRAEADLRGPVDVPPGSSQERRVGQEGGSTCRSRCAPSHPQNKPPPQPHIKDKK